MKHIKLFEAFKLPGRKPENLIQNCFSDVNDEFGDQVKWHVWTRSNICVTLIIEQILRKSEIEDICEEYILPGIGRMADEGFEFVPKNEPKGFFDRLFGEGKKKNEIYYKGIYIELNGDKTEFEFDFKNELK